MGFGRNRHLWKEMDVAVADLDGDIANNRGNSRYAEFLHARRKEILFIGLTAEQSELWDNLYNGHELGGSDLIAIKYKLARESRSLDGPRATLGDVLDLFYIAHELTVHYGHKGYEDFFNKLFEFLQTQKSEFLDRVLIKRFLAKPVGVEPYLLKLVTQFDTIKGRVDDLLRLKQTKPVQNSLRDSIKCLVGMEANRSYKGSVVIDVIPKDDALAYVEALMRNKMIFDENFKPLVKKVTNTSVLNALMTQINECLADPKAAANYRSDFDTFSAEVIQRIPQNTMLAAINGGCEALFCERLLALSKLPTTIGVKDAALVELLIEKGKSSSSTAEQEKYENEIESLQDRIKNKPAFFQRLKRLGLIQIFRSVDFGRN